MRFARACFAFLITFISLFFSQLSMAQESCTLQKYKSLSDRIAQVERNIAEYKQEMSNHGYTKALKQEATKVPYDKENGIQIEVLDAMKGFEQVKLTVMGKSRVVRVSQKIGLLQKALEMTISDPATFDAGRDFTDKALVEAHDALSDMLRDEVQISDNGNSKLRFGKNIWISLLQDVGDQLIEKTRKDRLEQKMAIRQSFCVVQSAAISESERFNRPLSKLPETAVIPKYREGIPRGTTDSVLKK